MANEDAAGKVEPKKKTGLIIAIVAIANVLIIGGFVFFTMTNKQDSSPGGANRSRQSRGNLVDGPIIDLPGFVVNLSNSRDKQYLKTRISIQLFDQADQSMFEKQRPLVQNEILLQLSVVELDSVKDIEGKRALEQSLVENVNSRLDIDRVANIYFTEFVTQ